MDDKNNKPKEHVLNRNFGIDKTKQDEFWNMACMFTPSRGIETSMLSCETYEELYNIARHDDATRPLSLIAMSDKELYYKQSMEYVVLRRFAVNKIGKYYNISLSEYLSLPTATQEMMLDIASDILAKDVNALEEIQEEFGNAEK